jgi:hypothetical protein
VINSLKFFPVSSGEEFRDLALIRSDESGCRSDGIAAMG